MQKPEILFLVGPTALGKTEVAVRLARKINAEIISCDSMQVYKGMDILTSKPEAPLRKKIKHHLISVVSPEKEYNVARYCRDACKKIKEILKRGRRPLFAGGTGLYMSILLDGIFKAKAENKIIRKKLYQEAELKGSVYLYKRLKKVDPEVALKIHPNDARRIVRALEVFQVTGKPISSLQKQRRGLGAEYGLRIFCLDMERQKLYSRIEKRIDRMFKQGLLAEVKRLLKLNLSKTACPAIGIRELAGYFAGSYDLDEAKWLIKKNTRNYAKRQLTWFRKDKRIEWIQVNGQQTPDSVANIIYKKLWNEHY
jgi:tRNA dimethylallyltransferase